jgi:hypothetical protein
MRILSVSPPRANDPAICAPFPDGYALHGRIAALFSGFAILDRAKQVQGPSTRATSQHGGTQTIPFLNGASNPMKRLVFLCLALAGWNIALAQQPAESQPSQGSPQQVATPAASGPPKHNFSVVKYQGNSAGWVKVDTLTDKLQDCSNNAPGGYSGKPNACLVTIDRDLPISPGTLSMPGGTTVYIKLLRPHADESIAFNNVTALVAPEDLAADALKSLVSPASSIVFNQVLGFNIFTNAKTPRKPEKPEEDTVPGFQEKVLNRLQTVTNDVQDANTALTCLETYKPVIGGPGHKVCDQTGILNPDDLSTADGSVLESAINTAKAAAGEDLPVAELKYIDSLLSDEMKTCNKKKPGNDCYTTLDTDQSIENIYNAQITSLQTAQGALLQSVQTLSTIPPMEQQFVFMATLAKNNNATITITGTEFLTKTATTIGTVTINTTPTRFVLSTGVMYTSTPYRSYAITNQVSGGIATGSTMVTKSNNVPSIDFPIVFGSYLFRSLSRANWENKCPNHCEFLFSGGVGLNLGAKTADFAGGPSFQLGGFIFTPVAVGARQNHLLNGVYVGQTNSGITTSSNLPTSNHWTVGGGFAITYTIPTP